MDRSATSETDRPEPAPDVEFDHPLDPAMQTLMSRRGYEPSLTDEAYDFRHWHRTSTAQGRGDSTLFALDPVAAAVLAEVPGIQLADPAAADQDDSEPRMFVGTAGVRHWDAGQGGKPIAILGGSHGVAPLIAVATNRSRPRVVDHTGDPVIKELTTVRRSAPPLAPANGTHVLASGGTTWGVEGDSIRAALADADVVVTSPIGFRSSIEHAKVIVAAAAMGIPSIGEPGSDLSRWVDGRLLETLALADADRLVDDPLYRDAVGVWLRRRVLAVHGEDKAWGRLRTALGLAVAADPEISILLPTRRPQLLTNAFRYLEQQSMRPAEVVVVIDADEDPEQLPEPSSNRGFDVVVAQVSAGLPTGELYNHALASARGAIALTWGDSDHYGRFHVEDLVSGLAHARGAVVGKGAEFVHIPRLDVTVQRSPKSRYEQTDFISDDAMGFYATDIRAAGGFPPVSNHPGRALIRKLREMGRAPYRLHGYQYISTSRAPAGMDDYLVGDSVRQWPGLEMGAAAFDGPEALTTARRYR